MSLTSPEIAAQVWDALRVIDLGANQPTTDPWSRLPDWTRDDVIDVVEMYRAGAGAEEVYTAQRDAALDAGAELDPAIKPWDELAPEARARGERMFELVQELAA